MDNSVFTSGDPVAIFGGGEISEECLNLAFGLRGPLVAADGGASAILNNGRIPDAVIGDLDSITSKDRSRIPEDRIIELAEQETTDFHKCLRLISAPFSVAVGFTGDRMDHSLAALNALVSVSDHRCLILGPKDICLHLDKPISLALPIGSRVSLFPMGTVTARSSGLKWPLDDLLFSPGGLIGTSNITVDEEIHIATDSTGMLLILPVIAFAQATDWLRG